MERVKDRLRYNIHDCLQLYPWVGSAYETGAIPCSSWEVRRASGSSAGQNATAHARPSRIEANPLFSRVSFWYFLHAHFASGDDDALAVETSTMPVDDVLNEMFRTTFLYVVTGFDRFSICPDHKSKRHRFNAAAGICAMEEHVIEPIPANGYRNNIDFHGLCWRRDRRFLRLSCLYQGTAPFEICAENFLLTENSND